MRPSIVAPVVVLTLAAAGCTLVGSHREGPADPPNPPEEPGAAVPAYQEFGGRVWLAGDDYGLFLEVRGDAAGGVQALLDIPDLSVEATGSGRVSLSELFLEFTYGGEECAGTITLVARLSDGGVRGEGSLRARDCTGSESGTLSILRRPFTASEI
jgi:hypothetical protein